MKIAIGTTNKAKVNAVKNIVANYVTTPQFIAQKVASNVSEQPLTSEETRQGAINRAQNVVEQTAADMGFGLEGGVTEIAGQLYICNWCALALADGTVLTAAGAQLPLPQEVAVRVLAGEELGPVMAAYTKDKDISQNAGAIGVFTADLVSREAMFDHIITLLIGQYLFLQNKA